MHCTEIETFSLQDLLQPEILSNPYPLFHRLMADDPIHEDKSSGGWLISRFDDASFVLTDRRFSAEHVLPKEIEGAPVNRVRMALARQMLFLDPPDHTRLRGLFSKAFPPNRVNAPRPNILRMTTEFLNLAEAAGGSMDFIRDLAMPLPVAV